MKKALLLAGLCLLLFSPPVRSEEGGISPETAITSGSVSTGDFSPQLIDKIKQERNTIYNALNLAQDQIKQKDEIEKKRYADLEPALKNFCLSKQKLKVLSTAKTEDISAKKIAEKELTRARKDIKEISNKYDKEFKKILNSEQRSKYNMIRKLKRAELKKLKSKREKTSSLRPFGVPVSQAEYTKQQKENKKNCFSKIFKHETKNNK